MPAGRVNVPLAYLQWIVLMLAGLAGMGWMVSLPFVCTMAGLSAMGCIYNIPPLRSKDIPYLDVLSESSQQSAAYAGRLVHGGLVGHSFNIAADELLDDPGVTSWRSSVMPNSATSAV